MNRLLPLTVVSLLAGVGLGAALGYYDARPWTFHASADGRPAPRDEAPQEPDATGGAVAEVDEPIFNFDKMERGTEMRHEFEIRNPGDKPLTVTFVSHTCKCTKVELAGDEVEPGAVVKVAPGKSAIVALEWQAKVPAGPFRHGGTFTTSDPRNSRLELIVEGDVVESTTLMPAQLLFDPIAVGETGSQELLVMAYVEPEVIIESYEFDDPEIAERMDVTIEPVDVDVDELPEPKPSAAVRVRATYSPAGVIGRFMTVLHLKTNLKKAPELVVPVFGSVRGDVSIFGDGWIEQQGLLRFPPVTSSTGKTVKLAVNVRGEQSSSTELYIASVDPPELQATLGKPKRLGDRLTTYPLEVTIPKGTRAMVRAGEDHGGEGEIVIGAKNSDAPELRMRVHFTVMP
ncbi:MAG: DUF1573 domain-containing protein [Planctomycetales bacterium]|nr:DUF1573 domain-containing protein [Planctomycetales bacterium]